MRNLFLFIAGILLTGSVCAQDTAKIPRAKPAATKEDSFRSIRRKGEFYRETFKHVRRKFDSSLFTAQNIPTTSDYAEDLGRVYQVLNQVPGVTESFDQLQDIDEKLEMEDSALLIIKERMSQSDRTLNVRNLQMFNTLLDALDKNVRGYSHTLNDYNTALDSVRKGIGAIRKDTLILHIFRDSALKDTFQLQLQQLKAKWRQVDSLIALNGNTINELKSEASAHAITITDLLYRVDVALKDVGTRAFGKERRYLWEPRSQNPGSFSSSSFQKSVESERQLARFYFTNNRTDRLWLLCTGVVFFFWVWYNFRTLRRMKKMEVVQEQHFSFVNPYPIAATFVFILSLAPLFDLHAPAVYIESIEFLLMIVLSFILKKHLSRFLFYGWGFFLFLFLLLPIIRIIGLPFALQRWAELILDLAAVLFASYYLFSKKHRVGGKLRFVYGAAGLYLVLNLLAVLCNLFGRVTLSQIFGATAVYSFAQTISLAVFVKLVVEAFLLQIVASRIRKGYPQTFDQSAVTKSIYRIVLLLAILLWLIVFFTNLNLFDYLNDWLTDFFGDQRQVGSFTFTLGGIVLFLGIIWLANFLQRFIAYFFGDTGDDAAMDDRGQRSRLLITRLVLLIGGFLLAVAASGLSVDRITVILGALGVGVGLGLQNIVNNFVSGIILIFDRPVRIGDTVELGDKRGRVKEIGIRSSTLLTEEGAEVIIPNGDVLSSRIVNWTLSNNNVRVTLTFTIDRSAQPKLDPKAIVEVVKKNPNVLDRRDPEVMVTTTAPKTLEVKVYFWTRDINKTPNTTGEVRTSLYHYFDEKGIVVN